MTDKPSHEPNAPETIETTAARPEASPQNGRRWVKLGVGAAIGSAAIAAAVLYANRPQRKDRG